MHPVAFGSTLLLYFGTHAYLFLSDKGPCYIFCCEFLAFDGVIVQSDHQSSCDKNEFIVHFIVFLLQFIPFTHIKFLCISDSMCIIKIKEPRIATSRFQLFHNYFFIIVKDTGPLME